MFKWEVLLIKDNEETIVVEGDWGKDVLNDIDSLQEIAGVSLFSTGGQRKIIIYTKTCVITIDNDTPIFLGVDIGGYLYRMADECSVALESIAPFTSAILDIGSKKSQDLDRHLYLKFKIDKIIDKVSNNWIELDSPVYKEVFIKISNNAEVTIG